MKEKGWIATLVDAAIGEPTDIVAERAAKKATDTAVEQVKHEIVVAKDKAVEKVDNTTDEIVYGRTSKYLMIGSFVMSAIGLGISIWNAKNGVHGGTTINVYYDRFPKPPVK